MLSLVQYLAQIIKDHICHTKEFQLYLAGNREPVKTDLPSNLIRFSIYKADTAEKLKEFCFSYNQALFQKEVLAFKPFKSLLSAKWKRILAKLQIKCFCIPRGIFE